MVSVLFSDSIGASYAGNNLGTSITVRPQYERENEILPGILAHEAAHYYCQETRTGLTKECPTLSKPITAGRGPASP